MVKTYINRIGVNTRMIWMSNNQPLEYVQKSDAVQDNKNSLGQLAPPFANENYEPQHNQKNGDKAINMISSWHGKPKQLEGISEEQKYN